MKIKVHLIVFSIFFLLKKAMIACILRIIHTYLFSSFLPGIEYSGTSPIEDFNLYAPGPGTLSLLFTYPSRVLDPKPNFGESLLFFNVDS